MVAHIVKTNYQLPNYLMDPSTNILYHDTIKELISHTSLVAAVYFKIFHRLLMITAGANIWYQVKMGSGATYSKRYQIGELGNETRPDLINFTFGSGTIMGG